MKKIYLSYSHHSSDNIDTIAFAKRITKDLEARGYKVWLDERNFDEEGSAVGIAEGTPFDIGMEEGIKDSDIILFLVTPKAVSERSICRKEIIYGFNIHKETLPVRISDVVIPIFICDIRDIDFKHGFSAEGVMDEYQYQAILRQIDDALQNFEKYKSAHNNKLQMHLLKTRYRPIVIDFVGRDWLFKECKEWIIDVNKSSHLAFLLGGPGTGKSAFLSVLTNDSQLVKSVHFCSENENPSRKASNLLLNWSYYLTTQDSDYKQKVEILDLEKIKDTSPELIFQELFIKPLQTNHNQLCFVADSLDEMEEGEGRNLVLLLKRHISEFPKNISFLVSSREERDVLGATSEYKTFLLSEDNNREDTAKYIDYMLTKKNITLTTKQKELLLEASECNFQYLYYWFSEVKQATIEEEQIKAFPMALEGILAKIMDKKFPRRDFAFYRSVVRPILSLLAVSLRPLKSNEIKMITGLSSDDFNDFKMVMESLIPGSNDIFTFYHKSLREYLTNGEKAGVFFINSETGERLMFEALQSENEIEYLKEYALVHVERALSYPLLKKSALTYLDDLYKDHPERTLKKLVATVDYLNISELTAVTDYINRLSEVFSLPYGKSYYFNDLLDARKLYIAEAILPLLYREGSHSYYSYLGLIKEKGDDLKNASEYYQKALKIAEDNDSNVPSQQSRRDLCRSIINIAGLFLGEQKFNEANEYYQKGLKIATLNVQEYPSYETRSDLRIFDMLIGDIFDRLGKFEEAKLYFLKAVKISERNAVKYPSFQTKRELSDSYKRLGDIFFKENNLAETDKYYLKSLTLTKENAREFPSYESRRDLSVSYNVIAQVFLRRKDLIQAKENFQISLELSEVNFKEFPSNQSKRDVFVEHGNIGLVYFRQEDNSGAKAYYQKALEIAEEIALEFPSFQSQSDLSWAYFQLGTVFDKEKNYSEARDYYHRSVRLSAKTALEFPSNANQATFLERSIELMHAETREKLAKMEAKLKEDRSEEEAYYRKVVVSQEEKALISPSYESRRDLRISYENLANLLRDQQKDEEAKELYLKAIEIAEKNASEFPNYESHKDLADTYINGANMLPNEDNEIRIAYFRKGLACAKESLTRYPIYQSYDYYYKVAEEFATFLQTFAKFEITEEYHKKEIEIVEKEYEIAPSSVLRVYLRTLCLNLAANYAVDENYNYEESRKYLDIREKYRED